MKVELLALNDFLVSKDFGFKSDLSFSSKELKKFLLVEKGLSDSSAKNYIGVYFTIDVLTGSRKQNYVLNINNFNELFKRVNGQGDQ